MLRVRPRRRRSDRACALQQASRSGTRMARTTRGSRRRLTARCECASRAPCCGPEARDAQTRSRRSRLASRPEATTAARRVPLHAAGRPDPDACRCCAEAACASARGAPAGRSRLPVEAWRQPRRRSWCARCRVAMRTLHSAETARTAARSASPAQTGPPKAVYISGLTWRVPAADARLDRALTARQVDHGRGARGPRL